MTIVRCPSFRSRVRARGKHGTAQSAATTTRDPSPQEGRLKTSCTRLRAPQHHGAAFAYTPVQRRPCTRVQWRGSFRGVTQALRRGGPRVTRLVEYLQIAKRRERASSLTMHAPSTATRIYGGGDEASTFVSSSPLSTQAGAAALLADDIRMQKILWQTAVSVSDLQSQTRYQFKTDKLRTLISTAWNHSLRVLTVFRTNFFPRTISQLNSLPRDVNNF